MQEMLERYQHYMRERYHQNRAEKLRMPEGTGKRYSLQDLQDFYDKVWIAEIEAELRGGINCPLPSICDSRIVHDGVVDKFDAVIVTNEQGAERAFRWVGSLPRNGEAAISLDGLDEWHKAFIEDPAKVIYMPGVVIDEERTFGSHMWTARIQQGGLEFVPRETAQKMIGVWEELRGNEEGAFYMFRNLDKIAAKVG